MTKRFISFFIIFLLFAYQLINIGQTRVYGTDYKNLLNPLDYMKDSTYTVLILGIDGDSYEGQRSDSIMLGRIDLKKKELRIVSIPRDSLVEIYDFKDKIGHAYAYGGPELTMEVIEKNFSIKVDGYLCLNFISFREFIESIGGIDVYMTEEEAEIALSRKEEGTFKINGEEALTFSRIRALDSDYLRTARQRRVVESIIQRLKELNRDSLPELIKIFNSLVSTNISLDNIFSLAMILRDEDIAIKTNLIPSEDIGYGDIVEGVWYLVFDKEEAAVLMENFLKGIDE